MVRKIAYDLYLLAFVITIIIFSMGILLGMYMNEIKLKSLSKDMDALDEERKIQETNLLLLTLFKDDSCILLRNYMVEILPKLEKLAMRTDYYERSADRKRFGEEEYIKIKKKYMILLVNYWLIAKKLEDTCGDNTPKLIYFYSNKKCDDCKAQGIILDSIKKEHKEIMIFSIDTDINLSTLRLIMGIYNVTEVPSLVINDKTYGGFMNKKEVEEILLGSELIS